jgi:2,5-furandicarboxylate decarboxylase 1
MAQDLRSFLELLAERRPEDIVVIDEEVSCDCGPSTIVEKLESQGQYPLVYCKNMQGSDIPLIINLGASYDRMALALGSDSIKLLQRELGEREAKPLDWNEVKPEDAPVKEVILKGDDVNLDLLPIIQHNEFDAGRYIDAAPLVMKERGTGEYNAGIYRHQKQGKNQLGVMINPANHGNYVRAEYEDHDEPTPCYLVIGHHPALFISAVAKIPGIGKEIEVAGSFAEEPMDMVPAETIDMLVPARAEIILEGIIPANKRQFEGPFGEWPKYYYKEGDQPYMEVTAMTMRKNPIYQTVYNSHAEHHIIGAVPRLGSLYRRITEAVPSVQAVNLPLSAMGRSHIYISLKKRAEGEPKQAAMAAFVTESSIKHAIVVDDDIDVFNEADVLWCLAMRFQADRDLAIIQNTLGSHLNPTAYGHDRLQKGPMETKLIFDATKPLPPFEFPKLAKAPVDQFEKLDLKKTVRAYDSSNDGGLW